MATLEGATVMEKPRSERIQGPHEWRLVPRQEVSDATMTFLCEIDEGNVMLLKSKAHRSSLIKMSIQIPLQDLIFDTHRTEVAKTRGAGLLLQQHTAISEVLIQSKIHRKVTPEASCSRSKSRLSRATSQGLDPKSTAC